MAAALVGRRSALRAAVQGEVPDQSFTAYAAAPAGAPRGGGTLTLARSADVGGMDPGTNNNGFSEELQIHIMDTLVRYTPVSPTGMAAGKAQLAQIQPGLAESWKISEDGLTWTFALRQGILFHDGTPWNADAAVYNIDRNINPQNPSYIKGKMINGPLLYSSLDSYKAVGPYTLQLKLKHRYAPLLKNLGSPYAAIVSPTALKKYGEDFTKNPVGTGAYKFVEWVPGDHVTVERNPDWKGGKAPNFDRVIFKNVLDPTVRAAKLEAGEVDFIDAVSPDDEPRLKQSPDLVWLGVPAGVNAVLIQCQRKPFNDVRVRRALNYAINRDELNSTLYRGAAKPVNSPVPPYIPGYDASLKPIPFDLQQAKALLAQAGYPNGFDAHMITYNTAFFYNPIGGVRLAEAVQQYLAALNVKVSIEVLDVGGWLSKRRPGQFDLCVAGWGGSNEDIDGFFYPVLHTDNMYKTNNCLISDPKLNNMIIAGQGEYDPAKRNAIYANAQRYVMDILPWIYINYAQYGMAARKRVNDLLLYRIWDRWTQQAWASQ